jgi:hypothetical protein
MSARWCACWCAIVAVVGCAGRALSDGETDAEAEGGSAGRSSMEGGAPATGGADGSGETGGTDSPGGVGSDVPRCVPGQSTECACADGRNGSQTCADDGLYESCVCLDGTLDRFRTQIVGEFESTETVLLFELLGHLERRIRPGLVRARTAGVSSLNGQALPSRA